MHTVAIMLHLFVGCFLVITNDAVGVGVIFFFIRGGGRRFTHLYTGTHDVRRSSNITNATRNYDDDSKTMTVFDFDDYFSSSSQVVPREPRIIVALRVCVLMHTLRIYCNRNVSAQRLSKLYMFTELPY